LQNKESNFNNRKVTPGGETAQKKNNASLQQQSTQLRGPNNKKYKK